MKQYRINEIFYSVQAEGTFTGTPAVFVRFSGCNLACPFCDTDHSEYRLMTRDEIEREVDILDGSKNAIVVFTGGEPSVQLCEEEKFCELRIKCAETNGIKECPSWIDWVTVSPKTRLTKEQLQRANELKFLFGEFGEEYLHEAEVIARRENINLYVQPVADVNGKFSVDGALDFVKRHPTWKLSVQWHKLTGVR